MDSGPGGCVGIAGCPSCARCGTAPPLSPSAPPLETGQWLRLYSAQARAVHGDGQDDGRLMAGNGDRGLSQTRRWIMKLLFERTTAAVWGPPRTPFALHSVEPVPMVHWARAPVRLGEHVGNPPRDVGAQGVRKADLHCFNHELRGWLLLQVSIRH